jgi:hypothetical protein
MQMVIIFSIINMQKDNLIAVPMANTHRDKFYTVLYKYVKVQSVQNSMAA